MVPKDLLGAIGGIERRALPFHLVVLFFHEAFDVERQRELAFVSSTLLLPPIILNISGLV